MKNIPITFCTAVIFISMGLLYACTEADYSDDFKPGSPPPIGDYNNSDEVAAANLVAKWSFEGNLTESKQSLAGTAHGTSFTTGFKGQAFKGSETGYADYSSAGPSLSNLKSFTVSLWVKFDTSFTKALQVFSIENKNDFWSNLTVFFETGGDSIRFKTQFNKEGAGSNFPDYRTDKINNVIGKWTNFIAVYDGTTSTYKAFQNNRKVIEVVQKISGNPMGELAFANVGRLLFGAWKQQVDTPPGETWQANFSGALDEFRVYNKALNDLEVSALYQLERQGR